MQLRILARGNNARGSLLTDVAPQLFSALSYKDLVLSVHRAGRELDVQARHFISGHRLNAECKAQPSHPFEEIRADILALEGETEGLHEEIMGGGGG